VWPFKKEQRALADAAWNGSWVVGQRAHEGRRMIVRRNTSAADGAGDPRFHVRIGVAVPFLSPDAQGMPGVDEHVALGELEDALFDEFQSARRAIGVLTITTGGMREFVFYAEETTWLEASLERVRSGRRYVLQSYTARDPSWKLYGQFK